MIETIITRREGSGAVTVNVEANRWLRRPKSRLLDAIKTCDMRTVDKKTRTFLRFRSRVADPKQL